MTKANSKLHCVLVQSPILWQQPESNLLKFEQEIETITNTDLIILPELFNTGFCFDTHLAETMDGTTVQWMQKMAKKSQSALMGSIMILDNDAVYNRMLLVAPSGEIQHYDKLHLFAYGNEDKYFKKGDKTVIFELNTWRIKPIICYDLRFPVSARNTEDYDALICVANWPHTRIEAWDTLLKARAIENQSYTIGVNRVGTDATNLTYIGHSNGYDPLGKPLLETSRNETMLHLILEKETILSIRKKFPFLNDRDEFILK
ncbi:nitrilase-related carbon-nitrogen hydrolase [Aquimarina agarilytica]|uniref:nitrilase-related carbon-nitrogen hydrolase n=1 Tax=Aquimarina agarilytica TaxID=1087449 RepID=UPI0002888F4D|nr:nitrilase-related carbon-nitrogen hydrolase [Aquimarina agarilytica]